MKRFLATASALVLGAGAAMAQPILELGTIVVSATAEPTEAGRTGQSIEVLEGDDLTRAGSSSLQTRLDTLPGVSVSRNGPTGTTGDFAIRGNSGRYIPVYIDGILATDPSDTSGGFNDFGGLTSGGISRIEILKGSQSALYGGSAVGGVVNISTLLPEEGAPMGLSQTADVSVGSYGSFAASYGLMQRGEDTTLRFGLAHARSDGFSAADENAGNSEADGFRRTRLSFGAEHDLSDFATIGFNGFVEDGRNDFDEYGFAPQDGTPDEVATNKAVGLRAYGRFVTGAVKHELAVQHYRNRRTADSPTSLPPAAPYHSRFDARRLRFDYQASGHVSDTVKLTGGFDHQREKAIYSGLESGSETIRTTGAFLEAAYAPADQFDLVATLRFDDHSTFGSRTTGRFAFSYRPVEGTILRGAIATGYRPPAIDELFGFYPDPFFPFSGNPDLRPETSRSAELGVDRFFGNGARISATLFRTDVDNLIQSNATYTSLVNVPGKSKRQGIELDGEVPLGERVTFLGNYTYTRARTAAGDQLSRVPEHDLLLGLRASLTNRLDGQVFVNHVADRVDTGPMPDYTVVNAGLSFDLTPASQIYLRVDNLTDRQYQTARGYGTSDRAFYAGIRADF